MQKTRRTKADKAREWISKEIRIGNFARGAVLPPERELADQIGVSYMTLRKAVGALVEEGILERNHGSGTFVRSEIPEQKVQKILGLVTAAWGAPENQDLIMHFAEVCEKANWHLKVVHARGWRDRAILDLWHNCDALVLTMVETAELMPSMLRAKLSSPVKPVVVTCADGKAINRDCTLYREDVRMEEPCDRLYELGHRRILLVDQLVRVREEELVSVHRSMIGFQNTFEHKYPDVTYNTTLLSLEVPTYQLPHHAIRQAFQVNRAEIFGYTAIICPLSFYWAVMSGLRDIGLRVPDDMSILTFGDRQEAEFYCPRPALFAAQLRDQACRSMELVQWRSLHPNAPPRMIQAATSFRPYETFAPARPLN